MAENRYDNNHGVGYANLLATVRAITSRLICKITMFTNFIYHQTINLYIFFVRHSGRRHYTR